MPPFKNFFAHALHFMIGISDWHPQSETIIPLHTLFAKQLDAFTPLQCLNTLPPGQIVFLFLLQIVT
jgi:hypothetical protein